MYPIKSYIACIEKLGIPYPEEGLLNFLSEYTQNFSRETDVSNIYFDGISAIQIKSGQGMSNEDIEDMFKGLIKFHTRKSVVAKAYQKANDILWEEDSPRQNVISKFPLKSQKNLKSLKSPRKQPPVKEILEEKETLRALTELNESLPKQVPAITLEDAIKILIASSLPLKSLIANNETKYFVGDVWLAFHKVNPDLENALWPFSGVFDNDVQDPQALLIKISSKLSTQVLGSLPENLKQEKFKKTVFKSPTLPVRQRWEIGISGNSQSLEKVKGFVETLPKVFPEIYMIKILNPEYTNETNCSKAEIYLETREPNIQKYLDALHSTLPKELAKMIMPKSCSEKPKFMSNIPAISPGHKDGCIFTFSQGGEEGYKLKEEMTANELKVECDGDSYYKFFGTLDVGIDTEAYTLSEKIINDGAKIMADLENLYKNQGKEAVDKEIGSEPVDITRGLFTELLFTFNISFDDLGSLSSGKTRIKYLWGIDSQYGEVIFVMKPNFYKKYSGTQLSEAKGKETFAASDKFILGNMAAESSWFTYRNPRPPSSSLFCVNRDKPNYTWCNTNLTTGRDSVDPYDVDVVLIPFRLEKEAKDLFSNGSLRNRLIFYDDSSPSDPEMDMKMGTRRTKDASSMSFVSFVNVQKEYMKRLLYHGLFKNSQHYFH